MSTTFDLNTLTNPMKQFLLSIREGKGHTVHMGHATWTGLVCEGLLEPEAEQYTLTTKGEQVADHIIELVRTR